MNQNLFAIVGLYAGLSALILLWLSASTIKLRWSYKISIGDGGNKHMARIMRGHANAVENMAILLILMIVMATLNTLPYILHGFGILLIASRALHANHFIRESAPGWSRVYPMVVNQSLMMFGALGVIGHAIRILYFS